jgi:hypothetical protein
MSTAREVVRPREVTDESLASTSERIRTCVFDFHSTLFLLNRLTRFMVVEDNMNMVGDLGTGVADLLLFSLVLAINGHIDGSSKLFIHT